ncbi:MAG: leucyl/phenylalanyl-tRNA--protein transferase [Bacteroidales bacterium]|jgi:leucyl/phenylalanyl-tRNA--protein transferase|nr:leucyl/phenylalanyl-tRNA--protein transferase [Bacteroidales bacterium]
MPIYMLKDEVLDFPPVSQASKDGLLAIGGDLSPERLLIAYQSGIFPWYNEGEPILWWSLDPRMVIKPTDMKITKSLWKTIESNRFSCSFDADFEGVIRACATVPRTDEQAEEEPEDADEPSTWISEDMIAAYCELHALGFAHSVETYLDNELVGGLYGVSIGKVFCAESMFHTKADASKVAFYNLCQFLIRNNIELIDAQQETSHMKRLGAAPIPRKEFMKMLKGLTKEHSLVGNWGDGTAELLKLEV